jgi:hypothetical protein
VGLALRLHQLRKQADREFRVGIIGLGAGTLATYANAIIDPDKSRREYAKIRRTQFPDYLRFYELNPLVEAWAEEKFTFLEDARERGANVEIFNGDARLVLERQLDHEEAQNFDVLILDAFSSDAIPIHLLTREALETYWQHLQSDGILALHVSNRFLDVKPVVHRLAIDMGKEIIYTKNQDRDSRSIGSASWMIMTNNHEFMALTEVHEDERELPAPGPQWTDDFSRLFNVLRED